MAKKLSQNEFIERCKSILGENFTYEKTVYVNNYTKVIITDKNGKDISIFPSNIKKFKVKNKKYTTEEFIKRAKEKYGNAYTYEKCKCTNSHDKIIITCPKHGDFIKMAYAHLNGQGCPLCGNRYDDKKFVEEAKKTHGDKYDYSKINYINNATKICVICPKHGEFWKFSQEFLLGSGCPKCKKEESLEKNKEHFFDSAKIIHKGRYNYEKSVYKNSNEKICITCPEHGDFWQTPSHHLNGQGCPLCGLKTQSETAQLSQEEIIKRAKKVHGDKYDYSKVEYNGWNKKVKIICPKHGEFEQTMHSHIGNECGCPKCHASHAERVIEKALNNKGIKYECQKTFPWLKNEKNLFLDFFLPELNCAIEFQGGQHFIPVKKGKMTLNEAQLQFLKTQKRDKIKNSLCKKHNLKIFYIIPKKYANSVPDFYPNSMIFNDIEKLILEIKP